MAKSKTENWLEYFVAGYITALVLAGLSPLLPLLGAIVLAIIYLEGRGYFK